MSTAIKDEQRIIDSMIERGVQLPFNKNSLINRIGLGVIREPYLGTLDRLVDVFIKMDGIQMPSGDSVIPESNKIIKKHQKYVHKAVAIAILNGPLKIFFLTRLLTWYLRWKIKPSMLFDITRIIRQIMNASDFISSIRLMSGIQRTTQPILIEEPKQA